MRPLPWRELEHTADVGLEVRAETLEDLVAESARAFYALLFGAEARSDASVAVRAPDVASVAVRRIEVEALDAVELFVSWLNELLFLLEVRGERLCLRSVRLTARGADAACAAFSLVVEGNAVAAPVPSLGIKAVTYGGALVLPGPPTLLRLFFDV